MKQGQANIKPPKKGSKPSTGNISDAELARVTTIPKQTLISWSKTDSSDWRYNHYWFLKSHTKTSLLVFIEKSKEFTNL